MKLKKRLAAGLLAFAVLCMNFSAVAAYADDAPPPEAPPVSGPAPAPALPVSVEVQTPPAGAPAQEQPTEAPAPVATPAPEQPTAAPAAEPTPEPTEAPTEAPTVEPTAAPTAEPAADLAALPAPGNSVPVAALTGLESESGVALKAPQGVLPAGAELRAAAVMDTAPVAAAIAALPGADARDVYAWQIELLADGAAVQPGGFVVVTLPIEPTAWDRTVYHIRDGVAEKTADLPAGAVTFTTDHFSCYAVAGGPQPDEPSPEPTPEPSPELSPEPSPAPEGEPGIAPLSNEVIVIEDPGQLAIIPIRIDSCRAPYKPGDKIEYEVTVANNTDHDFVGTSLQLTSSTRNSSRRLGLDVFPGGPRYRMTGTGAGSSSNNIFFGNGDNHDGGSSKVTVNLASKGVLLGAHSSLTFYAYLEYSGNLGALSMTFSLKSNGKTNDRNLDETFSETGITLTYDANGGEGRMSPVTQLPSGGQVTFTLAPNGFTWADHAFTGWSLDKSGSSLLQPGETLTCTGHTTVYAIWKEIVKHTVSFDANGGKGAMPAVTAAEGSRYPLPACAFTAPQYHEFDHWEIDGTAYAPGDPVTVNGDITVKAVWKAISYTVSFDAGGGTGTMDPASVRGGTAYPLPACIFTAPAGQTFDHWECRDRAYAVGNPLTVTGDITVKAVWKDLYYTVSFDAGGGTGTMPPETVKGNTEYTLPACAFTAPEYHEFDHWEIDGTTYAPDRTVTVDKDITVTATWKQATYTVTFNTLDGGTLDGSTTSKTETVTGGASVTAPAVQVKDTYTFLNWQSEDGTVTLGAGGSYTPTANITFNAVYGQFTVTYHSGYTNKVGLPDTTHLEKVTGGTHTVLSLGETGITEASSANGSNQNYGFVGWDDAYAGISKDSGDHAPDDKIENITKNIDLYGAWEQRTQFKYQVDVKGASPAPEVTFDVPAGITRRSVSSNNYIDTKQVGKGKTYTVISEQPTAAGYAFLSWYYKSEKITEPFHDSGSAISLAETTPSTMTLKAVWAGLDVPETVIVRHDGAGHDIKDGGGTIEAAYYGESEARTECETRYTVDYTYEAHKVGESEGTPAKDMLPQFKEAGTYLYTIKAEFKNGGTSVAALTKTVTLIIMPESFTVEPLEDVTYNGAKQEQEPTVKGESGNALTKGRDYTVTYSGSTTDAGTVTVTVTPSTTGSYGTEAVTLTYRILPRELKVTLTPKFETPVTSSGSDHSVVYDGKAHTASGFAFAVSGTGTSTGAPAKDWSTVITNVKLKEASASRCPAATNVEFKEGNPAAQKLKFSDALDGDDFTVTYQAGEKPANYRLSFTIKDANLTVTPAAVTVTADPQELEYNTNVAGRTFPAEVSSGTIYNGDFTYAAKLAEGFAWEDYPAKGLPYPDTLEPVITFVNKNAENNYAITEGKGSLTVTPKDAAAAGDTVTVQVSDPDDVIYNGEEQTPALTVQDIANSPAKTLTLSVDYTVTYTDNTDAGTATATVEFRGNYKGTVTKTFTVHPRPVTAVITPVPATGLQYKGVQQSLTQAGSAGYKAEFDPGHTIVAKDAGKVTVTASLKNDYLTRDAWDAATSAHDAGTHTIELEKNWFTAVLEGERAPNYTLSYTVGSATAEIAKAPLNLTLTGVQVTVPYDGTEHTASGFTATLAEGQAIAEEDREDICFLYDTGAASQPLQEKAEGEYALEDAPVMTATTVADSKAQNLTAASVTLENRTRAVSDPKGNYAPSVTVGAQGRLTVAPRSIKITVGDISAAYGEALPAPADLDGKVEVKVYDTQGGDNGNLLTSTCPDAAKPDYTLVYVAADGTELTAAPSAAGTYRIRAKVAAGGNNENYAITVEDGTLTVGKRTVWLDIDSFVKNEGEADPALTASVRGLAEGETLDYSLYRDPGEAPGLYTIHARLGDNPGYDVVVSRGLFLINALARALPAGSTGPAGPDGPGGGAGGTNLSAPAGDAGTPGNSAPLTAAPAQNGADSTNIGKDSTPLTGGTFTEDCCILHLFIMLLALAVSVYYTHDRKKRQEREFTLREQLTLGG